MSSVAIRTCHSHALDGNIPESGEAGTMADLQKLFFGEKSRVTDREVLATARLNARVQAFAGREVTDDVVDQINAAVPQRLG